MVSEELKVNETIISKQKEVIEGLKREISKLLKSSEENENEKRIDKPTTTDRALSAIHMERRKIARDESELEIETKDLFPPSIPAKSYVVEPSSTLTYSHFLNKLNHFPPKIDCIAPHSALMQKSCAFGKKKSKMMQNNTTGKEINVSQSIHLDKDQNQRNLFVFKKVKNKTRNSVNGALANSSLNHINPKRCRLASSPLRSGKTFDQKYHKVKHLDFSQELKCVKVNFNQTFAFPTRIKTDYPTTPNKR